LCSSLTFVYQFIFKQTGNFRFASLQSQIGQSLLVSAGRSPHDMSSIVLVRANGRSYFESDAILRISAGLDGHLFTGLGAAGKFVPRMLRDALYHVVSENRHLLGESDQCRLDFDGEFDDRFMVEVDEGL
jgi:predicted DCC family thiol-disulfide oxidoreductase YuxK